MNPFWGGTSQSLRLKWGKQAQQVRAVLRERGEHGGQHVQHGAHLPPSHGGGTQVRFLGLEKFDPETYFQPLLLLLSPWRKELGGGRCRCPQGFSNGARGNFKINEGCRNRWAHCAISLLMSLNPKAMPEPSVDGEDIEPRLKLECVASWRLFGWVQVGGALTVSYFSSLTSNSTEHGKCAADWWGERFTFVGLQECKALSCRVQVTQLVIPRKYFSISAPRSMTWPRSLSITLRTMRCWGVMCTMSGFQALGSTLKTGPF